MERKINIDLIRAVAIIMVIIIHVSNIYCFGFNKITNLEYFISVMYNSISRVCVPLFFMISGCLLIDKNYSKDKYIKRITKFFLILVIWSIIYFILNNYTHLSLTNIIKSIFISLFEATKTQRHLWFLYAILGLYITLPFIQNMCKNLTKEQENLFIILFMIFSGLSIIYIPLSRHITNSNVDVSYPIPFIQEAYYLGYFISGHILYRRIKNNELKYLNKKNTLWILFLLSTTITIITTFFISINIKSHYEVMFWYKSIFTIIASFSLFILMMEKKKINNNNLIINISNLSFGIYLIHMYFLNNIKENYIITDMNAIIGIPLITTIVFILSSISCIIIKKIPYLKKLIS